MSSCAISCVVLLFALNVNHNVTEVYLYYLIEQRIECFNEDAFLLPTCTKQCNLTKTEKKKII